MSVISDNQDATQTIEQVADVFYPTDEPEPLEAPTDKPVEDEKPAKEEENNPDEGEESETETEGAEVEKEETEELEEIQTINIGGVEHDLNDEQGWEDAKTQLTSMQADCTQKWQDAADMKKSAEELATKAQDLTLELEVLIAEDDEVDMEELKEYDEVEYYKKKEKLANRKAKLKELKEKQPEAAQTLTKDELASESHDFYSYNPAWQKDGKLTDDFQKDMKIAGEYLKNTGYSQDEVNKIQLSHHWKTIVDASKYTAQKKKVALIKKKVLKTPKASKPTAKNKPRTAEEIFYSSK